MNIETKFTFNGLPVLVTGGSFPVVPHIAKPLASQARVTYENGDTEYVDFDRLEQHNESVTFSPQNTEMMHDEQEKMNTPSGDLGTNITVELVGEGSELISTDLLSKLKAEIESFSQHLRETADTYYRGDDRDYDHGGTVDLIKDDFDSWFSEFINR